MRLGRHEGVKSFSKFFTFITENQQYKNFGRELVFSADLCYNEVNKKSLSLWESSRDSGERVFYGKISYK